MVDFYQHNIKDWEEGTKDMDLETEAIYRKICDQIYSFNDQLPDDDKLVARSCRVSTRLYRKVKKNLLGMGKIHIEDGAIRNHRCTKVVGGITERSASAREKQAKSVAARKANQKKNVFKTVKSAETQHLNSEKKQANLGNLSNKINKTAVAGQIAGQIASTELNKKVPLAKANGPDGLPLEGGEDQRSNLPDEKKYLFDKAIKILGGNEKTARSLCGRLLKFHNGNTDLAMLDILKASEMGDPRSWIGGVINKVKSNGSGKKYPDPDTNFKGPRRDDGWYWNTEFRKYTEWPTESFRNLKPYQSDTRPGWEQEGQVGPYSWEHHRFLTPEDPEHPYYVNPDDDRSPK